MSKRKKTQYSYNTFEFDWYTMTRDILREWWGILFVALAAFFLMYAYQASRYHKTYTTTTTFTVNTRNYEYSYYNRLNTVQKTADSFHQIIESSILKKKAAEKLDLPDLPGTVQVSQVEKTNLLTLSVTEADPRMAFDVMNAVLEAYPDVSRKIMGDVVLVALEAAKVPEKPDTPFTPLPSMLKAFACALAASVFLIGMASAFQDTVRKEGEVEDKLDTRLLGTLYHEKKYRFLRQRLTGRKKKTSILLLHPDISFRYVESLRKITQTIQTRMRKNHAKVLLIASIGENEGKSTVSANLALALEEQGNRVLLIDADFRKPALHKIFDLREESFPTLYDIVKNGLCGEECVYHLEGHSLDLLMNTRPSPDLPELPSKENLKEFIDSFRQDYDYIILDSSPITLVADTEELIDISDAAVLVVRQHKSRVRDINDAIDLLNEQKPRLLGCIFNDVSGQISLSHGYGGYSGYTGYGGRGRRYGYGYYGGYYAGNHDKKDDMDEQT